MGGDTLFANFFQYLLDLGQLMLVLNPQLRQLLPVLDTQQLPHQYQLSPVHLYKPALQPSCASWHLQP